MKDLNININDNFEIKDFTNDMKFKEFYFLYHSDFSTKSIDKIISLGSCFFIEKTDFINSTKYSYYVNSEVGDNCRFTYNGFFGVHYIDNEIYVVSVVNRKDSTNIFNEESINKSYFTNSFTKANYKIIFDKDKAISEFAYYFNNFHIKNSSFSNALSILDKKNIPQEYRKAILDQYIEIQNTDYNNYKENIK